MNNGFIYKYLLDLANKDARGNVITPTEINRIFPEVNIDKYNIEYSRYMTNQDSYDAMSPFLELNTSVALTTGSGSLPSDYSHYITSKHSGSTKPLDEITVLERNNRLGNSITVPTTKHAVCVLAGSTIEVNPTSITSISLDYFRLPATPVFDYYITAAGQITYLEVGASHVLTAGETGSAGQTSGTVSSLSVELEWHDDEKADIIMIMARRIGVEVPNNSLYQFASQEQAKNEV